VRLFLTPQRPTNAEVIRNAVAVHLRSPRAAIRTMAATVAVIA
jgi:hypothetical protein